MSRSDLLKDDKSYTFRSYFEMPQETDEILASFGVSFVAQNLSLPRADVAPDIANKLQTQLQKRLERVILSSEIARREALVSPILFEITELSDSQLRIEYALDVSEQLRGKLDYLVKGKSNFLVVEAKNDDTTRGFTQLAVELLALAIREQTAQEKTIKTKTSQAETITAAGQTLFYGAVTTGQSWIFGCFNAAKKEVIQDTSTYAVPNALQDLMSILLGILQR